MTQNDVIPGKIPLEIWSERRYEDIILYALGHFGPLEREMFINDPENSIENRMNKNTFHKWAKLLKKHNWIEINKEGKKSVYKITSIGLDELLRRLRAYSLDFESLNIIEQKRINENLRVILEFFKKYKIYKSVIKLEFLLMSNEITYDKFKDIYSLDKFNKLLLFLVLNHPKFYPKESTSIEDFIRRYNKDSEEILTKTDILFFLQKIIKENTCKIKIYKLSIESNKISLFFSSHSEYGIIFETLIRSRLKEIYLLKRVFNNYPNLRDLYYTYLTIIRQLIDDYNLFHKDLKDALFQLLNNYIKSVKTDIISKPFLSISEYGAFISLPKELPESSQFDKKYFGINEFDFFINHMKFSFIDIKELKTKNEYLINAYDKFFKDKEYNIALSKIDNAINYNPSSALTYHLKSLILIKLNRYDEALNAIDKAIKVSSEDLSLYKYKIQILILINDFQNIIELLEEISDLWVHDLEFYTYLVPLIILNEQYHLVEWLLDKGEKELDEEYNDQLFDDIIGYYEEKISDLLRDKYFHKVLKIIDEYILKIVSHPSFYKSKISALYNLGFYDEALTVVNEAIKKWPKYPESIPLNIDWGEKVKKNIPPVMIKEELDYLITEAEKKELISQYKFCILKAEILFDLGEYEQSLKIISKVIELNPNILQAHIIKALNLYNLKKNDLALSSIDKAMVLEPENPRPYYIKIQILFDMGHFDEYHKELGILIGLEPSLIHDIYEKAYYLALLKQKDEALSTIDELIKKNPNDGSHYIKYGKILMMFEEYEEAVKVFEKVLKLETKYYYFYFTSIAYIKIGKCYKRLGRIELTLKNFTKGKKLAEENKDYELVKKAEKYILELYNMF